MRLWSIHPAYLDPAGLTACWREGLLARRVMQDATRGYRNHPQLLRFKAAADPIAAIDSYLSVLFDEAVQRNYRFDRSKFGAGGQISQLTVASGQLAYERQHLLHKLRTRDPQRHDTLLKQESIEPHPLFRIAEGAVEQWEKL